MFCKGGPCAPPPASRTCVPEPDTGGQCATATSAVLRQEALTPTGAPSDPGMASCPGGQGSVEAGRFWVLSPQGKHSEQYTWQELTDWQTQTQITLPRSL